MRYMVIVKANEDSEKGVMPTTEQLAEMGAFNEQLVKAGIMLAGDGLKPSSTGKRIKFVGSKKSVVDGPFAETKELIAGFWIWQVRSMDEAVEWANRTPFQALARIYPGEYGASGEVEIRQVFEMEGPDGSN